MKAFYPSAVAEEDRENYNQFISVLRNPTASQTAARDALKTLGDLLGDLASECYASRIRGEPLYIRPDDFERLCMSPDNAWFFFWIVATAQISEWTDYSVRMQDPDGSIDDEDVAFEVICERFLLQNHMREITLEQEWQEEQVEFAIRKRGKTLTTTASLPRAVNLFDAAVAADRE